MNGNEQEFRFHPKHKPIPYGWVKTGRLEQSHHGEYSILIKKINTAKDKENNV